MSVVALWADSDHLLSVLAPIGLAWTRRPSIVIDLDPAGPRYQSPFTLADLVAEGPTAAQLKPTRRGTSVLANGGVGIGDAAEIVGALALTWPNVVLRCDPSSEPPDTAVSILPLLPGPFAAASRSRSIYQDLGLRVRSPEGALVLPPPARSTLHALVRLDEVPVRSRWLKALAKLWGSP